MRGRIVDWEMSLRYKYPTINTDTYTLNEEEREWKGDEELRRGWEGKIDGKEEKTRKGEREGGKE